MLSNPSLKKAIKNIQIWRSDPCKFVRDNFNVEPDEWQKDVLEAFADTDKNKQRISMTACAGPGKGNSDEDLCLTDEGLVKYRNISIGDYVFAESGKRTRIKAVKNWGKRDFYKVIFCDGTTEEVSDKHVWKVKATNNYKRFRQWTNIETDELYGLDLSAIRTTRGRSYTSRFFKIPNNGAVNFKEKKFDVEPYCLGLWLGDGCRNKSTIIKNDTEPFEYLRSKGYSIYTGQRFTGNVNTVHGLITDLKKLGISELYSGQRYIPEQYFFGSIQQRKDLLSGLLDTDSRIKKNGMLDFHSTSKQLIIDIVRLARSLGCYAHYKREEDTHRKNACYSASIRCNFNPYKIKRKAIRWRQPPENRLQKHIDRILYIGKKTCICIEVEDKLGCYQTKNFNVTHNSTVHAWCALNFLLCYASAGNHPKGAAVSITQDNLRDNLWPEIAKWMNRSELLRSMFTWTKTRVFAKDYPETWFISARSWSKSADEEEQGRTLSGLHSDYVLYLIDESGDIPIPVLRSAEQGLTSCRWGKILQAGNPTSLDGMLYAASTKLRDKWFVINITGDPDDPKRSPRIDIEWARDQIKAYGRDNPWVMSYILGQFPPSSINTLLGPAEVEAAMKKHLRSDEYSFAQKRLGVDAARFGDDPWCVFPRQGLAAFKFIEMRNPRSEEVAARVAFAKAKWGSELEFFDGTGGFASGAIDALLQAGHSPIEVHFSGKAIDPRYFNKRSEMWFEMAEWVKRGGALPYDAGLIKELTAPTYTFVKGKFMLEEKEQIKKRLGFSPNKGDGLALTFALPEMPSGSSPVDQAILNAGKGKLLHEFDPFDDNRR